MKRKRPNLPMQVVLDWLEQHHPDLHETAEIDRAWVWLTANLQGDHHKQTREALKKMGFIFHRHGGHPLESGATGTWGNACEHPVKFKRKPHQKAGRAPDPDQPDSGSGRIDPLHQTTTEETSDIDKEALAFIGG